MLVAGFDYSFGGTNYAARALTRSKQLLAKYPNEEMTFTIIDCAGGVIRKHVFSYLHGKRIETPGLPTKFARPVRKMFEQFRAHGGLHYRLKDGQSGLISPMDIYGVVREIGRTAPGTLLELSFLGHGWEFGPVHYNSRDDGAQTVSIFGMAVPLLLPDSARDPDDFDPRPKDFDSMSETALQELQAAFHPEGYAWLWGCASPATIHQILTAIERHPKYRSSGVGDDVEFEFHGFNDVQISVLNSWLQHETRQRFDKSTTVTLQFKYLKYLFLKLTAFGYAQKLAWRAGVKTYAALVPTYSFSEGRGLLSRIHPSGDNHIRFYQNYLGFELDPEGRRYGVYKPDFKLKEP